MNALVQTGRYAAYVDAAWGASAALIAVLVAASWLSAWRWRRRAEALRPGEAGERPPR